MRIGMMVDVYKPHVSGITNYIDLNKHYLEQAGHEVYIFTLGKRHADDDERVIRSPGLPLYSNYPFGLRYNRRAQALLKTMDVCHVHHPFLSGTLALRYCPPAGIPVLFTNHTRYDIYANFYAPPMLKWLAHLLINSYMPGFCAKLDMLISPSPGMADVLRQIGVKTPITIAPNGVDVAPFRRPARRNVRTEMGLAATDIVIVYTGRLAPEKNLPLLLNAFARVSETHKNTHLLMIGDGPAQASLRQQAPARVHFTGKIPYPNLPDYLRAADLFATPSASEVHPLSVIEAMAAGLPVAGIHSVGVGDTIHHNETGLLCAPTLNAYTTQLTRLCSDRDLRTRLGKNAQIQAAHYDIHTTSATMLSHYETLVRAKRPAA